MVREPDAGCCLLGSANGFDRVAAGVANVANLAGERHDGPNCASELVRVILHVLIHHLGIRIAVVDYC